MVSGELETDDTVTIGNNGCLRTGGTVNIDCEHSAGTPPFTYTWVRLPSDVLSVDGPIRVLNVSQAGTYLCTLINECATPMGFTTITGNA